MSDHPLERDEARKTLRAVLWQELVKERDEARAEIERLRQEKAELEAGWQRTYDHDIRALRAENDRLRAWWESPSHRGENLGSTEEGGLR